MALYCNTAGGIGGGGGVVWCSVGGLHVTLLWCVLRICYWIFSCLLSPGSPALSGSLFRPPACASENNKNIHTQRNTPCWYTHICFPCFFCAPMNYANGSELESKSGTGEQVAPLRSHWHTLGRGHLHDPMSPRRRSCAYWLPMGPMLMRMLGYQQILPVPPPPASFVALRSLFSASFLVVSLELWQVPSP